MKLQVDDMELQDDRDPTRYRVSLDIPQIKGGGEFQVNVLVNDSTLALVDIRVDERGLVRLRTKCWVGGQWGTVADKVLLDSKFSDGKGA